VSLLWGAYTRRKGARYADDQDSEGRVAEREVGGEGGRRRYMPVTRLPLCAA